MNDWLYRHRIIARLFILAYIIFFSWAMYWFMTMPNPTESQTAMITGLFGIGAAWYALYLRSVKKECDQDPDDEERKE